MLKTAASAVFLFALSLSVPAFAQATRTWVSGVGDDANTCSRTAPCKTWAGAISKTATGGEIDALDPGGFGALTITKSITLDGGDNLASVLVSATNGITIQGTGAIVTIRRLAFDGLAGSTSSIGLVGINVVAASTVHIEDCYIFGFQTGIEVEPNNPASNVSVVIRNTVVENNTTAGIVVGATASGDTTTVTIDHSSVLSSVVGLYAQAGAVVTSHDSLYTDNTTYGMETDPAAATNTDPAGVVNVERGIIANNGTAVFSNGTVTLSDVMVSNNTTGLSAGTSGTGTINSFSNNRINAGNGTNGSPTATLQQQ